MRVFSLFNRFLGAVLVVSLSLCIATSAASFGSILRRIQTGLLGRSLPGSLAFAPAGAVGYYPPPLGPIINEAFATDALSQEEANPATVLMTPTAGPDESHGAGQALAAVDRTTALDEPRRTPATVTGTVMKVPRPTGSSNKNEIFASTSLLISVTVCMLLL